MEQRRRAGRGARRRAATRSRPRRCSSPTRPTRPARGGSAAAEIHALREVFGEDADRDRDRQHQGLHRPPDGRRHRGRRRGQGAGDRHRAAGAELPRARPRARDAQPLARRRLPGALRAAPGRRLRLADQHAAAALDAGAPTAAGATPRSSATTTGSPTAPPGRPGCGASAGYDEPQLEVVAAPAARRRPGAGGAARGARVRARRGAARRPARAAPAEPDRRAGGCRACAPARAGRARAGRARADRAGRRRRRRGARSWQIVAEQTGYPADLLDLDLDLEADLGIDTVKQAEVFAAIREAYGIERDDTLKLRDYPTLNHVVGFVHERAPQAHAAAPPPRRPRRARAGRARAEPRPSRPPAAGGRRRGARAGRSWPSRRAIRPTCSTWTSTSRPIWASTRSSRPRCSPRSASLRDRARRLAQAARLPDAQPRRRLRPRARAADHRRPHPSRAASRAAEPAAADARAASRAACPSPVLRPPLERCVDTGVTLGAGSRVVLMPDAGGVGAALAERLDKLGVEVLTIDGAPDGEELEARLADWTAAGPIQGVYWLPALDDEGPLADARPRRLARGAARRGSSCSPSPCARWPSRSAAPARSSCPRTRLGGRHGYDAAGATLRMGGAVTGFTKALARERPDALVKAVDFAPEPQDGRARRRPRRRDAARPRRRRDRPRRRAALDRRPRRAARRATTRRASPRRDTVFVVTGAAGSIVSAITADLAAARPAARSTCSTSCPSPTPAIRTSRASTPTATASSATSPTASAPRGERPTPKLVERELARIERARAALDAIDADRARGRQRPLAPGRPDRRRTRSSAAVAAVLDAAAASTC